MAFNLASLYIHTIGAGGGSLVWIDEGNHLQVGLVGKELAQAGPDHGVVVDDGNADHVDEARARSGCNEFRDTPCRRR